MFKQITSIYSLHVIPQKYSCFDKFAHIRGVIYLPAAVTTFELPQFYHTLFMYRVLEDTVLTVIRKIGCFLLLLDRLRSLSYC